MTRTLTLVNRLLRPSGLMLTPRPYSSAKALREHADVSETHHPSHGGNTVRWMRHMAHLTEQSK